MADEAEEEEELEARANIEILPGGIEVPPTIGQDPSD